MTSHREPLSAQRRRQVSMQKDKEKRPQDIKKEIPRPVRRSYHPHPPLLKGQKRRQEAEHLTNHILAGRPQKRLRPLPANPSPKQTADHETASGLSASQRSYIDYWRQKKEWPMEYYEQHNLHRLLARKKSSTSLRRKRSEPSLITQSSATPSDQRPREEKSAPYKNPRYELQLKERGSFMGKYEEDVTDESKSLCQKLLGTPQTFPEGSLFADDLFEATCAIVQNRNETRVIRDIAQLVVPSAEILAIQGAKHLRILTETVNKGWNNSIPLLGPRPQPDYSLGFKREAFNRAQLRKLQPLIGGLGDESLFVATYHMYLPFLTAEVKCGAEALDVADRQNANSMTLALRGLVELFRVVGREKELHREINSFSISHDNKAVRIYGHYAAINRTETTFYRHAIHSFDFTALDGKEKWTARTFVQNVYDIWLPSQFERICSVIDELPEHGLESETPGLSQHLENQILAETSGSHVDLQQITPDTSAQPEKPASKKKKGEV